MRLIEEESFFSQVTNVYRASVNSGLSSSVFKFGGTGTSAGGGVVTSGTPFVFTNTFTGLTSNKVYQNGAVVGEAVPNYAATQNDTSNRAIYTIGGSRSQTGGNFVGDIAENIVYLRDLTDIEQQKVDTYLGLKYGITQSNDSNGNSTANDCLLYTSPSPRD